MMPRWLVIMIRTEAYWALGIFTAIVVVAALVNRFSPAQRVQIRRIVILYIIYIVTLAAHFALGAAGETVWASRFLVGAEFLQDFTLVNLAATAIFSVLLPATGVMLPMIASDLIVGVGYIATTLGILSTHGVNPASVVAAAGLAGAAGVISMQNTLSHILGGIALQLDGSIHVGDWIQLENGKQGRIRNIRWRHTVVETRDWSTIIVPNALLLANNITILGKREGRSVPQRMWVWFNVDFRYPPTKVIDAVMAGIAASPIPGVATDPQPNCVCMDFTKEMRESYATYAVRYWLTDLAADDPTNSRVRARIFTALRRAGIPLAVPASRTWIEIDDEARTTRRLSRAVRERLNVLRQVTLFHPLNEEELEQLAQGVSHVIYCAGEMCTKQGAVAHWLYILASGTVEIRTNVDPDGPEGSLIPTPMRVATLTAPDVFGEMGLMTGAPRLADVVATTDVDCYRLDKTTFERVLLARPEIAHELSERLASRRVELLAVRDGLNEKEKKARQEKEKEQILSAIRSFFSL